MFSLILSAILPLAAIASPATIGPDSTDPNGANDIQIELPESTPYWGSLIAAIAGGAIAYARLKHQQKIESQKLSAEQQANSQRLFREQQAAFDEQQNLWVKRQDDLLDKKDATIAQLQTTISELQSELTRLHRELAGLEARYEERHKQLQHDFEEHKKQREAAFDRIRAENDRLRGQVTELQSYLGSEQQANNRILDQYNATLQLKESLELKIKALEKRIAEDSAE